MNLLRKAQRKTIFPKRFTEYVAAFAFVSTFVLLIYTKTPTMRLLLNNEVENHNNLIENKDKEVSPLLSEYTSTLNASSLNNTRLAENQIIFFNRVPKVGSQMFLELLRLLAIRNNFNFSERKSTNMIRLGLTLHEQEELAKKVNELPTFSVYQEHVSYTNFTKFDLPVPIYINLVRDPVERVISWFYYIRAPWYFVQKKLKNPDLPLPKPQWLRKDYETCVLTGDRECSYIQGFNETEDYKHMTQFFCGNDDDCLPFNSKRALDQAKLSVEKQFGVVGVLEDFDTTLAVFEKYIPRFFAGATEVYNSNVKKFKAINKNSFKPPISEEVKSLVRQNFTKEIEFYEFCKQRLHAQFNAVV